MNSNQMRGMAQSVLGPVLASELGPTMTHEHLLIDFRTTFSPPTAASDIGRAHEPVSLENLGWVRYHWNRNRDNLLLTDEETAIREAELYRRVGGRTIVEATTIGIGRDPLGLARVSTASGIHVIMGAGFYVAATHSSDMDHTEEEQLAARMIGDISDGVDGTNVKAGIIGEIGCTWPLTANERKVLRAAAAAQKKTGAPILIHPGRSPRAPFEILDVLAEAGADIRRTIMSHLDRTYTDEETLLEFAARGSYLEYDLFGVESSYYPLSDIDMPSDAQRLDYIGRLVAEGYQDRIVVGHDVFSKHRLVAYGGHGYGHILENIVPRMRRRGMTEETIHAILVDNPARVLAFA